jgi:hypothetical protein
LLVQRRRDYVREVRAHEREVRAHEREATQRSRERAGYARHVRTRDRLRACLVSVFLLAALLVACTPVVPPVAANVDRICDTLCRRRGECRPGWDQTTCQASCRDRGSKRRPYWRADYVEAAVQCLASSSCDVILERVERACFIDTRPEPTDLARRACMAVEAKQRECIGSPEDVDECLNKWEWRLYSDPVLEELIDCEKQHCGGNRRKTCINEAMGGN